MRRAADRAADIAPGIEPGEARRDRGRRSAGGAPGGARHIPGIVRRAIDRVVALVVGEHQRHVGLAEQNDACLLEPLHRERARRGDVVLELRIAPGGRRAGDVVALLDRHGYAVERPPYLALVEGRIRRAGAFARAVGIEPDDGIEARIVFLDARKEVIQRIDRADLALTDKPRNLGGRLEVQDSRLTLQVNGTSRGRS